MMLTGAKAYGTRLLLLSCYFGERDPYRVAQVSCVHSGRSGGQPGVVPALRAA